MKLRKLAVVGIVTLTFGMTLSTSNRTASAATWHSSNIPVALRGNWRAKQNSSQRLHIYKHSFKYTGESIVRHVTWHYLGNHFYKFKYSGGTITVHYFNHHKLSSNSFWHSYIK